MELLDEMARLLEGQAVTVAEYEDLFGLLLRSCDLGHIPPSLDAVVLASAGKMRLDAPEYVFVLGLAEGEFPASPGENGLLTHADRDALMHQQIELPDCFENRVVREQVCFYKALTAPSKGLWMSWPKGQDMALCAAVEPIVEALAPAAPDLELLDLAATPAAALDCLGGGWMLDHVQQASLTQALQGQGGAASLAVLDSMSGPAARQLEDLPALETLLGRRLRISPSQMEKYYSCRYGYFLQYVLGLRPRRKAELSADQSGTLMHWVLQMALDPHPGPDNPCARLAVPFAQLDDEALEAWPACWWTSMPGGCCRSRGRGSATCCPASKRAWPACFATCGMNSGRAVSTLLPVSCALAMGRMQVPAPAISCPTDARCSWWALWTGPMSG